MEFVCNGETWKIEEVDYNKMKIKAEQDYVLGLTVYKEQKIYLDKDQADIIRTLKHELTHVWLWEYGHPQNHDENFTYENVCNIVASSNDFINDIVNKYTHRMSI